LGIYGLAWGTVAGGLLHIAIQVPALFRYRFHYRPTLNLRMAGVIEVSKLMGPRIITLGAIQLADLIIIRLASALPPGSTSSYFYGFALMQLPETLLGTAIALVIFPTLAELYNAGQLDELRRTAATGLSIIWTLTFPAAAALILLGQPAIVFFLQGGAFDENSTSLVYSILVVFSVRIISEATLEMVARLFYAQHNTRTPMLAYLGWLLINITAAYLFVGQLGIVGLALASTVAFTFLSAALFVLNRRHLGGLHERELAVGAGRALLATAGMALVILVLRQFIPHQLTYLAAGGLAGSIVYLLLNLVLGGQEIPVLIDLLRRPVVTTEN
jgi:putative peptidoglycan lipid II flippase